LQFRVFQAHEESPKKIDQGNDDEQNECRHEQPVAHVPHIEVIDYSRVTIEFINGAGNGRSTTRPSERRFRCGDLGRKRGLAKYAILKAKSSPLPHARRNHLW
jgi:hypothetical protein